MSTITVTLGIPALIQDIKEKSFMNTARIKDPQDQYEVRAAEENEIQIKQSLQEAFRSLKGVCRKFLQNSTDSSGNDTLSATWTGSFSLTLDVTARRSSNIGEAFSQAAHTYLVSGALRRFYTSAAMSELVAQYAAAEEAARQEIVTLLHTKQEPVYTS